MGATEYEALRKSAAWIDLSDRGKVRVTGEDAGRLLHAMTTNNVKELEVGQGLYAFFLNEKGRILADCNLFRLSDSFWLDTEGATASKIHHLLDKYIIADDAAVEDVTSRWFEVGVEGPESVSAMERMGLAVPEKPLQIIANESGYTARAAATGPLGFRIWIEEEKGKSLLERLSSAGIPQALEEDANVVRLENGVPRYGADISERYLVQETQALHGVHFSKGCYLGQEIVERVRSRGQVHRVLTPIRIEGSVPFPEGTKLVLSDGAMGEVTSSAYSPALNTVVGLAYVRTELAKTKPRLVVAGTDPEIYADIA